MIGSTYWKAGGNLGVSEGRKRTGKPPGNVGLSMKSYKKGKEDKTCLGERQLRGRIGKALY